MDNDVVYIAGGVIRLHPAITIGKRAAETPMGLAPLAPGYYLDAPSLHFVGLTWSCESRESASSLRADMEKALAAIPKAHFVIMANTEAEVWFLSRLGVPAILANELMFIDESGFVVRDGGKKQFDAVYTARLVPFKRHELAARVQRLLLLHGQASESGKLRVKNLLPSATFGNFAAGKYRRLAKLEVAECVSSAKVGLALSAEEGSMCAFMEYLLCGLPVVTTKARGGRARFELTPFVRTVEADADEVAKAVRELVSEAIPPNAVREAALSLLALERKRFMDAVDTIVKSTLGAVTPRLSFSSFQKMALSWRPAAEVLSSLA